MNFLKSCVSQTSRIATALFLGVALASLSVGGTHLSSTSKHAKTLSEVLHLKKLKPVDLEGVLRKALLQQKQDAIKEGRVSVEREDDKALPAQDAWGMLMQRQLMMKGANGKVDPLGHRKAMMAQYRAHAPSGGLGGRLSSTQTIRLNGASPTTWVDRGPEGVSGRAITIAINPNQTSQLWQGSAGGGLWTSNNKGTSWTPVNDWFPSMAFSSVAFQTNNPSTMLAGTGEAYFNLDAIEGAGLFRSTDSGVTWTLVPGTDSWGSISQISFSPLNPNIVLVAVGGFSGGLYRSTDGGQTFSTVFGGDHWNAVGFTANGSAALASVLSFSDTKYHVMKSTDGGISWSAVGTLGTIGGFLTRVDFGFSKSSPNQVYASVASASGTQSATDGTMYVSTDAGSTWTAKASGYEGNWYSNPVWVDPTNPNYVAAGGVDLFLSTDGATTWKKVTNWSAQTPLSNIVHADLHAIVSDPAYNGGTNRTVYVATDSGIYVTSDIRTAAVYTGWTGLRATVHTTQFYGADATAIPNIVGGKAFYGGLQDNGSLRVLPPSKSPTLTFGGDGGNALLDYLSPLYYYGEYVYANVHRSTNGGNSAQFISGNISDAGAYANFIAPMASDPNDPTTIFVGAQNLWRLPNARSSVRWNIAKGPDPSYGGSGNSGGFISAIAVDPSSSDSIWVGQNDGKVLHTTNGTALAPIWAQVGNGVLPGKEVTRIFVDPSDSATVYVGFGGYDGNNIFKSTDSGASWTNIQGAGSTSLPNAPLYGITRHPSDPNWLIVGTDVGLFYSQDGGATWSTNSVGPGAFPIDDCKFVRGTNTLVLATHGRGIWTADLTQGPTVITIPTVSNLTVAEMQPVAVPIPAMDSDTFANLTFTIVSGPTGATIDQLGVVHWVPAYGTARQTYPITVKVSDDHSPATVAQTTFNVTVTETNAPTILSSAGNVLATPGGSITIPLTVTDPHPWHHVTVTIRSGPTWATLQTSPDRPYTTTLSLTLPRMARTGNYPLVIRAVNDGINPNNLITDSNFLIRVGSSKLQSFAFLSPNVEGGQTCQAEITLTNPAPPGGLTLKILNRNPQLITTPATITIPEGQVGLAFDVPTLPVSSPTFAYANVVFPNQTIQANIRLLPYAVSSVSLGQSSVSGSTIISGTVTLSQAAPTGGVVVSLSSSAANAASVQSTVTIPAGATSASFAVTSHPVANSQSVTISATTGGNPATTTLTVNL